MLHSSQPAHLGARANSRRRPQPRARAVRCRSVPAQGQALVQPQLKEAAAYAPATVANLGPGFDWLGCAVQGDGDVVTARALPGKPGQVIIESIEGDNGRLSLEPEKNCIGIAALETFKLIGQPACGVALTLKKGLPLGSGMGSSAASAAAAAWAVNGLFGCPVPKDRLVLAGLASEAAVSGYHADNVAPAIMGGFVLVRECSVERGLDLVRLPWGGDAPLWFVLVNPRFEAPTAQMRAVLPPQVPFKDAVHNCCQGGSLVAAILQGDPAALGASLGSDCLVEPVRGPLIPGLAAVKEAAAEAGAFGCTISGAGPTAVAIVTDPAVGERVAAAMGAAFRKAGQLEVNSSAVVALDEEGARLV